MFDGSVPKPIYVKHSRPKPMTHDIQLPTLTPGIHGHFGRQPFTDYQKRLLLYRQRVKENEDKFLASEAKRLTKEAVTAKYDKHVEKKVFQRLIAERFKEKVNAYEEGTKTRREKLKELLSKEQQEFVLETLEKAQKGVESKMEEMKAKAELLKAQREEERLKVVQERRMMQLMNDCKELRPVLIKRNLVDSKTTHIQQMKENEMRKEADRELDHMWHDLMMKEIEAKKEKDEQDILKKHYTMSETMETWQKQIEGKELAKQEAEKIAAEDRLEMIKLQEQLRREQIEALDAKRRKRDKIAKELLEQIAVQQKYIAQRKKEEDALNQVMSTLAQMEIEREKQKIQDTTAQAKREMAIYREHLKQLEEERKLEEKKLNEILDSHRKMIEKKQEEAYCQLKKAKDELHRNVLVGRAEQLEYKRREAENQLKLKEAENELLRMACETNERLQAEYDRLQAEQVRQYREDLKRQIESCNEKRRLEKEQLERELAEGLAEEERRRRQVVEIINSRLESDVFKHPFRRVLERPVCPCPNN